MKRRDFLERSVLGSGTLLAPACLSGAGQAAKKPNVVYVFADQWRAQATGYAGDPNLAGKTPNLDRLASEGVNMTHAVSTCPVCTPYRASLMTGQYPLTNGLFLNDACLNPDAVSIGKVFKRQGYNTAYVGKWHIDGHGRSAFIPKERRQGFDYWKVLECTHQYNNSKYYDGDDPKSKKWDGYDAIAQTRDVQSYIMDHAKDAQPFCMFLSWGPPHAPYGTAPLKNRKMFDPASIKLPPNFKGDKKSGRERLAGYYAHIAALDECVGDLLQTLREAGIADQTLFVFTSDHGDMLGSHGEQKKQKPYDESIRVPFLVRLPKGLGANKRKVELLFGTPDIMPTILGLCGIPAPQTVEGTDFSAVIRGAADVPDNEVLIECPSPFGQWSRRAGGREYRGLRTKRFTYVRDLNGAWLLFDNQKDPYQQNNLVNAPEAASLMRTLEAKLTAKLSEVGDAFEPGPNYIRQWGYPVDQNGTIRYSN